MRDDDEYPHVDNSLLEGFDAVSWEYVECFSSRVANPEDMHSGHAVFAVADSFSAEVMDMNLPQPAMWHSSAGSIPVLIVQAERHSECEDTEPEELYGVLMPNGLSAVTREANLDWVEPDNDDWLDAIDDFLDALSDGDARGV